MAGERRLERDLRRLPVADLAHHDDVGVLPQHVAERLGEADADLRLHGHLVERVDDELDRVLDRDDVDLGRRDGAQRRVERRRLAAARGARDQDHPVRAREELLGHLQLAVEHPELRQLVQERARVEDADDELLAEGDGDGRHAHLDLAVAARGLDAAVLRAPLLGDVEARQRLDARDDGRVHHLGQLVDVVEHAVDAHAHDRDVAPRLDVDVAGALVERVVQDVLDRRDDVAVARLDLLDAVELHEPLEVADVDARRRLLLGRVDRPAEAVEVRDEALDVARRRDDEVRLAPHVHLQRLDERVIQRIGDGDRDGAVVGRDDEGAVPPRERAREELRRELRVDLQRVEVDERQARRAGRAPA